MTGLLSTYSNHRVTIREREQTDVAKSAAFTAHHDFVMAHRASFDRILENYANDPHHRRETQPHGDAMSEADLASEATFDEESALIDYVLDHALRLEAIARRLLIDSMPRDSMARTILLADRQVQLRDVKAVGGDVQKIRLLGTEEDQLIEDEQLNTGKSPAAGAHDNLDAVRRYRETFAGLVAGGARLQKLEGDQRLIFERTRRAEELAAINSRLAEKESRISSAHHEIQEAGGLSAILRQKKRIVKAVWHAEKELSHLA